jgi:hypothetical protein
MYNVGPDFTRSAEQTVECECGDAVFPAWNGYEGVWECPSCGSELDVEEGDD